MFCFSFSLFEITLVFSPKIVVVFALLRQSRPSKVVIFFHYNTYVTNNSKMVHIVGTETFAYIYRQKSKRHCNLILTVLFSNNLYLPTHKFKA